MLYNNYDVISTGMLLWEFLQNPLLEAYSIKCAIIMLYYVL